MVAAHERDSSEASKRPPMVARRVREGSFEGSERREPPEHTPAHRELTLTAPAAMKDCRENEISPGAWLPRG